MFPRNIEDSMRALNSRHSLAVCALLGLMPRQLVPGDGNLAHPVFALVGEAPGSQEVLQGKPFVGAAGKNLDGFLSTLEVRREDIYITNTVKYRPTKQGRGTRLSNRPPTTAEVGAFIIWLKEELTLLAPPLIVTLGNTALKALAGDDAGVGQFHGKLLQGFTSIPVFALYHPAAIIYNQALKDVCHRDLLALKAVLANKQPIC